LADINGKLIEDVKNPVVINKNKFNINFIDKPKGIYMITVKVGDKSTTKKIVIE
jgi:hypothetical protein